MNDYRLVMMDIGTIMFVMSCMHVRSCVGDVIYICRIEFVMRWMCYIVFVI